MAERQEDGERVILVHLQNQGSDQNLDFQEFHALAVSAGACVVNTLTSSSAPNATYCIGSGKVEILRQQVAHDRIELVLFDCSLTPTQERNLERAIQCRVLDRTGLILDIFAKRARTYEGKLQVELAQLKHHATRLIRGWTHLERQKGGIGLRGPGETQLEVDRREIKTKIKSIQIRLDKVRLQRAQGRRAREKAALPTVSLVGYTNTGKSTLFNVLTGSQVLVADQLFATLDPTLRMVNLPPLGKVILADTVGFIRQLPHHLVEAFKATLEETKDADLLLHVVEAQDEFRDIHMQQVEAVLEAIGALSVPRIEVYNKIDLGDNLKPRLIRENERGVERVFISAKTGAGLDLLREAIVNRLSVKMLEGKICLSSHQARERAKLFALGAVVTESLDADNHWILQLRLPEKAWQQLCIEHPEFDQNWLQGASV